MTNGKPFLVSEQFFVAKKSCIIPNLVCPTPNLHTRCGQKLNKILKVVISKSSFVKKQKTFILHVRKIIRKLPRTKVVWLLHKKFKIVAIRYLNMMTNFLSIPRMAHSMPYMAKLLEIFFRIPCRLLCTFTCIQSVQLLLKKHNLCSYLTVVVPRFS